MNAKRWLLLGVLIAAVAAFFAFDLGQNVLGRVLPGTARADRGAVCRAPARGAAGLLRRCTSTIAALSIPGAAALTLVGGALFGVVLGTVLVSFASAIGATLAFLVARTLLGDWVQQRFADRLQQVNEGVERDGALYLCDAAADRRVSVLAREPADGAHETARLDVLLGEPARHAARHAGLRVRRQQARRVSHHGGPHRRAHAARDISADRALDRAAAEVAAGVCTLGGRPPSPVRLQHGRDRRGQCRAGLGLHRRGDACAGRAGRGKQDGRRLSEHRLRAVQGADPSPRACSPTSRARATSASASAHIQSILPRRWSACSGSSAPSNRMIRSSATRRSASTASQGRARITSPWTVEVTTATGPRALTTRSIVIAAGARPAVPPIPGLAEVGLPHLRHGVGSARAAAAPGGARRRADRLRAGAGVRPPRRRGDAGRDAAANPDARGRRSERPGARQLRGRWRACARRSRAESSCRRRRRKGPDRRPRRPRGAHRLRPGAGRSRSRRRTPRATDSRSSASGPPDNARWRPMPRCRRSIRTSRPAAMSPARTSSRTRPRTRRGTRRSTRCSVTYAASRPTIASYPGRPSPTPRSRESGSTSRRRVRRTFRTRRRSTASTTSIARSPRAPRAASSRC